MTKRSDAFDDLANAYDGPIPPAEIAAARWGRGAFHRMTRAAALAGAEARVRAALHALRRTAQSGAVGAAIRGLERVVADTRRRALAALAAV